MERIVATSKTPSTTRRKTSAQTASEPKGKQHPPAATPKKQRTAPRKRVAMTPTEHVRVRVYYLSLERNGYAADPIADWLRAERELVTGTEA